MCRWARLRRPAEPLLAASGMLDRDQANPGGEVAAALEDGHRWHEGLDRHRSYRPDPWHGLETAGLGAALRFTAKNFLQVRNLAVQQSDLFEINGAESRTSPGSDLLTSLIVAARTFT